MSTKNYHFEIDAEGIKKLKEEMGIIDSFSPCFELSNAKTLIKSHVQNVVFTQKIYGLQIEDNLDPISKHGVMTIEGILWDSEGFSERHQNMALEEVAKEDFLVFETNGFINLLSLYPMLKTHIKRCPIKKVE